VSAITYLARNDELHAVARERARALRVD
jgi:hypothetical protein